MTQELPPVFEPTTQVDLVSVEASKILSVNIYSGRAEITRLYKFSVKTGQNLVSINGLPNTLDPDSLRVEGRGAATIHDVTISNMPVNTSVEAKQRVDELTRERKIIEDRLARCRKGLGALEKYLSSFSAEHTDSTKLATILQDYDDAGEALNAKALDLEEKIKNVDADIEKERKAIAGTQKDDKLRLKASIGVFAASEGEIAIALIYAVNGATWTAGYDIRVDMDAKEKPVRLIYKAAITQNTGESWEDVELNLETAAPTFGVALPTLNVQKLTSYDPDAKYKSALPGQYSSTLSGSSRNIKKKAGSSWSRPESRGPAVEYHSEGESEDGSMGTMEHRGVSVSKGKVNATFRVPGLTTLPSDGVSHTVTVVQLDLEAAMSWVAIPKVDVKTHLQAKITNASDYTLLPGTASIYVDGSFIARTQVPLVSPQENFDCPLGLDPSIRITYHPQVKKVTQSGLLSRTSNRVITQRITIFNSKTTPVNKIKILDQMPISEIANVTVKLLSPPLTIPEAVQGQAKKIPAPVRVGEGVTAQWEGAEEQGFDVDALGADGKFYWMCAIPAKGKTTLALQWEIASPARTPIYGI